MNKTIDDHKKFLRDWFDNDRHKVTLALAFTESKIKFLESIYMTGAENSHFSDEFKHAALVERSELCLFTSACHSLLKEWGME